MGPSEKSMNEVMGLLQQTVDQFQACPGIAFQHDKDTCGYVTTSPERAGTGMQFTAKVKLPKLTMDGTVDRIRQVIEEKSLDVEILDTDRNDADNAWGHFDLLENEEIDEEGQVQLSVNRTFGVSEATIVCQMYIALKLLQEAEDNAESMFSGNETWLTAIVEKVLARFRRRANQAQHIMEMAQAEAEKAAAEAERLARLAAEEAQQQTRQAMEAAQAAAAEAQSAAHTARDMDLMDAAAGGSAIAELSIDLSSILDKAASNPLAIVLDVERVDAPSVKAPKAGEAYSRVVLIADSKEQHAAWVRALKWLEEGCAENMHTVRQDPRMYPGGIPPRPLTEFEWAKLKANIGLLDMPFSSIRTLLHMLQHKHALGVTQAFDREYALWVTFQMELYTFQTKATDLAQRMSGIEHAIEAFDGCNFGKALQTMCLIRTGRLNSLSFRKQRETFQFESEFVALRIIQTVVGAWVALKARDKFRDAHPSHPFWSRHPNVYRNAVLACRDQRLRTLGLLNKLVRRQEPMIDTASFMMKEEEEKKGPATITSPRKLDTARGLLSKVKQKGANGLGMSAISTVNSHEEIEFGSVVDGNQGREFGSVVTLEAPPLVAPRPGAASTAEDKGAEAAADAALSMLVEVEEITGNPVSGSFGRQDSGDEV